MPRNPFKIKPFNFNTKGGNAFKLPSYDYEKDQRIKRGQDISAQRLDLQEKVYNDRKSGETSTDMAVFGMSPSQINEKASQGDFSTPGMKKFQTFSDEGAKKKAGIPNEETLRMHDNTVDMSQFHKRDATLKAWNFMQDKTDKLRDKLKVQQTRMKLTEDPQERVQLMQDISRLNARIKANNATAKYLFDSMDQMGGIEHEKPEKPQGGPGQTPPPAQKFSVIKNQGGKVYGKAEDGWYELQPGDPEYPAANPGGK